jgi:hypothetical protein
VRHAPEFCCKRADSDVMQVATLLDEINSSLLQYVFEHSNSLAILYQKELGKVVRILEAQRKYASKLMRKNLGLYAPYVPSLSNL